LRKGRSGCRFPFGQAGGGVEQGRSSFSTDWGEGAGGKSTIKAVEILQKRGKELKGGKEGSLPSPNENLWGWEKGLLHKKGREDLYSFPKRKSRDVQREGM